MIRYPGCACFWLEPTGKVALSVRRYSFSDAGSCGPNGYHNASRDLGIEIALRFKQEEHGKTLLPVPKKYHPGRRAAVWPKTCDHCDYRFTRDDEWQVNQAELYIRSDNGERVAVRGYGAKELAGALYDAWWLHERTVLDSADNRRGYVGPDGIALVAVCPNGAPWEVDGPSRNGIFGPGWTRTGDPREPETLTVSPSIVAGDYHGFLQNGRFTDDLGS